MVKDLKGELIGVFHIPPLDGKTRAEITAIAAELADAIASEAERKGLTGAHEPEPTTLAPEAVRRPPDTEGTDHPAEGEALGADGG